MPIVSRRSLLKAGAGAGVLAIAVPTGAAAAATVADRLRTLERQHGARLGVYGRNLRTGRVMRYRAGERFAMCSVFKTLAVAHLLRDYDHCGRFLDRVVHYTEADMVEYSPITSAHLATGMPYRDLCAAALQYSDDTAANLILKSTGGPPGMLRTQRQHGHSR